MTEPPDDAELRRRLTGAGASRGGGAGPAGEATMAALGMVSGEVSQLRERLGRLDERMDTSTGTVSAARQELEDLRSTVQALKTTVADLQQQVTAAADAGPQKQDGPPPPKPWQWEAMDWRQELAAVRTLLEWLPTLHAAWRPALSGAKPAVPVCWAEHPDMCRALSAIYVAHQQAYHHPQRRAQNETDFWRVLHDRLHDIGELAKAYRCHSADTERPHLTLRTPRAETAAEQALRRRVLDQVDRADADGDGDAVAELMTEHGIDAAELRAYVRERFAACRAAADSSPADVVDAARMLLHYRLIDADRAERSDEEMAAELAEDLAALAAAGGEHAAPAAQRLEDLRAHFGPLLRRQAARWLLPLLQRRQSAEQAGDTGEVLRLSEEIDPLAARYGVGDEDTQRAWRETRA